MSECTLHTGDALSFHCLFTAFPLPFHCLSHCLSLAFHWFFTAFHWPLTGLPKTTAGVRSNLYYNYTKSSFSVMTQAPVQGHNFVWPEAVRMH